MSETLTLPDWLVLLVGRQALENEALRQQLRAQQDQPTPAPGSSE